MVKTMTPSEQATSEQIDKLADQVRHAARKAGLTREQMQSVLKGGKATTERIMTTVLKIASELSNTLVVSVDYTRTIASLIEEAAFDWKCVDLDPDQFPVMGKGELTKNVEELHLNRTITNRELFQELEERNQEFADPHTALALACQQPDEQRKYPLVVLFKDSEDQLWCLLLDGSALVRGLGVDRDGLDDDWYPGLRFLVVRK